MTETRRRTALVATAAAAATAGLGWQWWRSSKPDSAVSAAGANGVAGGAGTAAAPAPQAAELAFWTMQFVQPDGQLLTMQSLRGAPLLLNFWATWCPPCIKEMPEIDRFATAFASRGGRVLGLAVDNPGAVRSFLQKAPVRYAIGMAGYDGTELSRKLGNGSGALPYTALFAANGAVVQRRLGETSLAELSGWAAKL